MIGVIDSGMGGLTTLAFAARLGADNRFCYYADTANAPYGNKEKYEIVSAVHTAARRLIRAGADGIILGCNTASVAALAYLQRVLPCPVWGVTPPVEEAQKAGGDILLLCTQYTARFYATRGSIRVVRMPQLATLIDDCYPDPVKVEDYCRRHLDGIPAPDNLVLGCTHYALVAPLLQQITRAKRVFDANKPLAKQLPNHKIGCGLCVDILASGAIDSARYTAVLRQLMDATK